MKRYTLSDSDMLGILAEIDSVENASSVIYAAVIGTWNAILAQEGTSFALYTKDNSFNPTEFGIPRDQKVEIAERMKTRLLALNISPIGVTNAMMDFTVQYGPSYYEN